MLHKEVFSASQKGVSGILQRRKEQEAYIKNIASICDTWGVRAIAAEFPHGSQSNKAAVAMSMVTSALTGYCVGRNLPVFYYSQFDSKAHFIGTQIDIKDLVVMTALRFYQPFGYRKPKTKKDSEATADAIAVFDLFLWEHHRPIWNVVHSKSLSL